MDLEIDYSRLQVGTVIAYKMRPGEMLSFPEEKEWYGKIVKTVIGTAQSPDLVWIESLDENYKGLVRYVFVEQIIRIEGDM